jgi:hypothetical protein
MCERGEISHRGYSYLQLSASEPAVFPVVMAAIDELDREMQTPEPVSMYDCYRRLIVLKIVSTEVERYISLARLRNIAEQTVCHRGNQLHLSDTPV